MKEERASLDWPQPLPRKEAAKRINAGVKNAAEELGIVLSSLSFATRTAFTDLTASAWEDSPSRVQSLRHLCSLMAGLDKEERFTFAASSLRARIRFREIFRVLGTSNLLALWIIEGEWRFLLEEEDLSPSTVDASARFWAENPKAEFAEEAEQIRSIRIWHRRETLRLAWLDIIARLDVGTLTSHISALADSSVQVALALVTARLGRKFGGERDIPDSERLCVLSMGKLGGNELNYRSDIDLIFLYDDESQGLGRLDAQTWHSKVVESLMRTLSQVTEHGFVYRVDARLRPDGARGALAKNASSTLNYYRNRGTTWERQAMLKVRVTGGRRELGEHFIQALQPWIFRRFLTLSAVRQIQGLKRQIEHRAEAQDETYRDVKTGFGGIRDIEFIVQFLQLLHGGRSPSIRGANTLRALGALEAAGILREEEALHFAEGYAFLRRVEHMLQLEHGTQTHRLPESARDFELLARRLGYYDEHGQSASARLRQDIDDTTSRTRALLLLLFTDLFTVKDGQEAEVQLLLDTSSTPEEIAKVLEPYGLTDVNAAWQRIRAMATEQKAYARFAPRVRAYLASALPSLLTYVKASPDPDTTLANFERITAGLGAKGIFYELVATKEEILRIFGALCAYSTRLVDIIQQRPGLLDEFLELIRFEREHDLQSLRAEVEVRSLAAMDFSEGAQWTQDLEMLRIGLFDVSGRTSTHETMRGLATLAHAIVGHATKHALSETLLRFPQFSEIKATLFDQFVVVALGKFGAGAMNYESDLDLIFVSGGSSEQSGFYNAATKLLRKELSKLYEVDLRLRPMGSAGTLVSTIASFANYFNGKARFWERLALTRARVVVNADYEIGEHVVDILHRFVYESPLPDNAAQEVERMREEMVRQAGKDDLKRGVGALLDFEMVVEYLQLVHGRGNPDLRHNDVISAAEAIIDAGLDERDCLAKAKMGYLTIRRVLKRLQLSRLSLATLEGENEKAIRLARMLGFETPDACRTAIDLARNALRRAYDVFVVHA